MFFPPRDTGTAKRISEALGQRTIVERKVTSGGHIQEREFGRPLMNAAEIMAMGKGRAIVFTPATPPILLKVFSWQDYKEATAYTPPDFRKLEIDENLARDCREASTKPDWQEKLDEQIRRSGNLRRSSPHKPSSQERDRQPEEKEAQLKRQADSERLEKELKREKELEQQQAMENQRRENEPGPQPDQQHRRDERERPPLI